MRYTHMLGNMHLTDFPDCKDAVIEVAIHLEIPKKLKTAEKADDRRIGEF